MNTILTNIVGLQNEDTNAETLVSIEELVSNLGPIKFEKGVKGELGEYQDIEVKKLSIDRLYQRFVSKNNIVKAKSINLNLLQPLVVWVRPNESHVVVDGQHKSIKCYLGEGKDFRVPCQVFYHPKDRDLKTCRQVEALMFEHLNMSRKNVTGLDKYRTGIAYRDPAALEFERNLIAIGVHIENLGDTDFGVEVRGWVKTKASWDKFGLKYTKNAVDFLKPIYKDHWEKNCLDGTLIYGLAAIFYLMDQHCGPLKAKGLRNFLDTTFYKTRSNKWQANSSGDGDYIIIARRIVDKYNMYVNDGIIEGSTIGESIMKNAGLASLENI